MARLQTKSSQPRSSRGRVRGITALLAATVLAVAILWGAGWPPSEWLSWLDKASPESSSQFPKAIDATAPVSDPLPSMAQAAGANTGDLPGTDSSLSKVPLPLYLMGVAPGGNVHEGTAQIGTSIENPQTYTAGAMLLNGARLAEIHADHVLLTKGERSVRLALFDRSNLHAGAGSYDELLSVGGAATTAPAKPASNEALTEYLRPSPVYDGDILRGYKVYSGKKAGVFSQLGLQPGDVVTSIDGVPLIGPAETIQMLRQLTEGAALTVTIERGGTRIPITLDGTLILAERERVEMVDRSPTSEQSAI